MKSAMILASQSPYRKKLLAKIWPDFLVVRPLVDEEELKLRAPKDPKLFALFLAEKKAESVFDQYPDCWIIGSDQVVVFKDEILGKSGSKEKATQQLMRLQGQTHELYTAVALIGPGVRKVWLVEARLHMRALESCQIQKYLDLDQPYDCAGSYKIEERGLSLFTSIDCSDWTTIEGLPLLSLHQELLASDFIRSQSTST